MVNATKPINHRTVVPSLSLSLSPAHAEETPPFLSPMPQQLALGHVTLTNDCEEFVQGLDGGIESYFDGDYPQTTMTAQALLNDLRETLAEDGTPLPWRLGFLVGRIVGLLNPDLIETSDVFSCVEVLSHKCQVLYPGPDHLSSLMHAAHHAAGIAVSPVDEEAKALLPQHV